MAQAPQQWHAYLVDFEPLVRTKPGKRRPCIAIQPTEFADAGLRSTVVLPLTTRVGREEAFPLRVRVPAGTCGLRESDVLIDQIIAWDQALFLEDLGVLPEELTHEIRRSLAEFLDL